jgi:hypothetical protein
LATGTEFAWEDCHIAYLDAAYTILKAVQPAVEFVALV